MANVATKPGMSDQTSLNLARDGKAKTPQTSFAIKDGMKDMTTLSGIGPSNPGSGPDAGDPNPLAAEPRAKLLRKQGSELQAAWDMTDGDGDGLDLGLGAAVLDEAQLSSKLPGSTSEKG